MNLTEFYPLVGGNYSEVKGRLLKDERIYKYVRMFVKDTSYSDFAPALAAEDYLTAFRCAHTLKGLCANLGLENLREAASDVCEALRPGVKPEGDISGLIAVMDREYAAAVEAVNALDS